MEETSEQNPKIYLHAVNYVLGELKDISTLDYIKNEPGRLEKYYKMGLKSYSESDIPTIELAYHSIVKTLEDSSIEASEIDILLFVSEHRGQDKKIGSYEVNELAKFAGMSNAYGIGLSLSDCANILLGIQMAQAMVNAGQAKNIMVVCAHKYSNKNQDRLMEMDVSICSDGAVSAIVSSTPGDYLIKGVTLGKYAPVDRKNGPPLDLSIKKIKTLRTITKALLTKTNLTAAEIGKVHINNYYELSQIFIESCGFKSGLGYYENLGRNGHVLAGDTLINLKDKESEYQENTHIILLADGPYASFAVCLQKQNLHRNLEQIG
jgi:3-oxoacyl-[acyl-carrier-protein] synthase-3